MTPIRVLLADDNPAILEMLVDVLKPRFVIAGALSTGTAVLREAPLLTPDIILLDISLGDMSGFEVARRLLESNKLSRILFVTVHENADFIRVALELGVRGYVFKSQLASDLLAAIETVVRGEQFVPADFA